MRPEQPPASRGSSATRQVEIVTELAHFADHFQRLAEIKLRVEFSDFRGEVTQHNACHVQPETFRNSVAAVCRSRFGAQRCFNFHSRAASGVALSGAGNALSQARSNGSAVTVGHVRVAGVTASPSANAICAGTIAV